MYAHDDFDKEWFLLILLKNLSLFATPEDPSANLLSEIFLLKSYRADLIKWVRLKIKYILMNTKLKINQNLDFLVSFENFILFSFAKFH